MKKLPIAVTASLLAFAPVASADVLGFGASVGYWDSDLSGEASRGNDQVDVENDLNLSNNDEINLSAYLEHPIPLLPNVRLSYVRIDQEGRGQLSTSFDVLPSGVNVSSQLDWTQADLTLYYEVLDNWVNLDLGLTARNLDAELVVQEVNSTAVSRTEVDAVLPMLYAAARFDLPLTGLSVGAHGNVIGYDGDSIYDYDAYAQYQFVGVQLRAGYRQMTVDYEDGDDRLDVDIAGPFVSAGFSF
ncbi:outer membrane protein [Marinobacter daqiaonensis]|uniref:Outer membrane protein n=1 Tax=Marinobacter daqiaonensis TaxID=650891 RepID=A0A1I6H119_9GAMM|nr:TIGR04219 family outer membrane beta-barrel protein [Marinobacter daqiaonensis]SFR48134.1 outer membrane protein [Marinobacter daqiaonensis]